MIPLSDSDKAFLAQLQTDLGQLDPVRASILLSLIPLIDLDPQDPDYVANLYPFDDPAQAKQLALHQSSCGITTEVGWRAVPVDEPVLYTPIGKRSSTGGRQYPVALERDDALKWDASTECTIWTGGKPWPTPGDAMIVGCASCQGVWSKDTFRSEHEFTVARVEADGTIWSADGGQPGVRIRKRRLVEVPSRKELWVAQLETDGSVRMDASDMRPMVGRRVLCYIDASKLKVKLET